MSTIIKRILTDKKARSNKALHKIAVSLKTFEAWATEVK
jgi:hypothetical protein